MQPGSAMAANMWVAVSQSTRLCSMSTVNHAKPVRAMKRAAVMLARDSQVPTDGWPAFKARLTGLGRMQSPPHRVESVFKAASHGRQATGRHTLAGRWFQFRVIFRRLEVVGVVIVGVFVLLVTA